MPAERLCWAEVLTSSAVPTVPRRAATTPALEPHHLLIDIAAEGASLCQLTGRLPVRVDGHALVGSISSSATARVEIGHSVLTVCPGDLTAAGRPQIRPTSR